jgi:two-component system, chemotaxis family, chemotaxis protein CheY
MKKKKILIIDDSPLVLEMAKDILEEAGYIVQTATNGIEANQHIFSLDEIKPDLILLDIMMPLLSGEKKAHLLRQSEHSKDIPVLLISSKPEQELKELAYQSYAVGYLCKPFTKYGLIEAVRDHI